MFYKRKSNGNFNVGPPNGPKREIKAKTLPNGEKAEPFKKYKVRLLKDIPSGEGWDYEAGDEYYVQMPPHCMWYLVDGRGTCFKSDAEENEDFEFIN